MSLLRDSTMVFWYHVATVAHKQFWQKYENCIFFHLWCKKLVYEVIQGPSRTSCKTYILCKRMHAYFFSRCNLFALIKTWFFLRKIIEILSICSFRDPQSGTWRNEGHFSYILWWLQLGMGNLLTSSAFIRTNYFKVQFNFDIPQFESFGNK